MKHNCNKLVGALLLLFLTLPSLAQTRYTSATDLTLIGKHSQVESKFHRIDTEKYPNFSATIRRLFTNSAGLAVLFKTNASSISVKWSVAPNKVSGNNTGINHSGIDLYIKKEKNWYFAGSGVPQGFSSTRTVVNHMEEGVKECMLYLPTYNELLSLEIGVPEEAYLEPLPNPFPKKVLVYGSSITQGASASRPGMAYLSRLSRNMNIEFYNLGLSGNGKMEPEVADMVAQMAKETDAVILDCAANPSPELITERTNYIVKKVREENPTLPIVMIQSVYREGGLFDTKIRERVANQNKNFEAEYLRLKREGVKNLYLIRADRFLGFDHEGTVDGTHPNDLGFDRMIKVIEPQLKKIFKKAWR